MRKNRLVGVALTIGLTIAGAASAAVNPDLLTVSGRFNAERAADGPMKGNLAVGAVGVPSGMAEMIGGKPDVVKPAMVAAMERSLRNFGYLPLAPAVGAIRLTVDWEPLEVETEAEATAVIARLRIRADGPGADCVPTHAEARFRALAPIKAAGNQRATAWVMVIGLAAVGLDASQAGAAQLMTARATDAAANARRERTEFEGVSPDKSAKGMTRYAALNASQLATADLIRQLGKSACPARPTADASGG